MKLIKATSEQQLNVVEELYLRAFPATERKPFPEMVERQKMNTMDIFSIESENGFWGLAILAHDKDITLLDYFAISDELRGQGLGSLAIRSLQELFKDRRFILEIETTKKPCIDLEMREQRKSFYLRNGLHTMDFDVNLFGVEMEILSNAEHISYEEYIDVYRNACDPKYEKQIHLIEHT